MRITAIEMAVRASVCAVPLCLAGCGVAEEHDAAREAVDLAAAIDPSTYAGDVSFRIAETFPTEAEDIPFALYLGLAPQTGTRLGANALVDLRDLQRALPRLLTGAFEPSCGLGLDLEFLGAEATGDTIRARAVADARLYRCRNRGTDDERRGARLLTQKIDLEATVRADFEGECIAFDLVDLDLAPKGLLGGLANMFGVTEKARGAILEKARATLAENPVCPDLPPSLELLDPHFQAASLREIGDGGIGASLSGSVDLSAATVVALLARVEVPELETGETKAAMAAHDGQAVFRVDDTIEALGDVVDVGLDIRLAAVGATRIGIEIALDLRGLQARLPEIVAGQVLVDTCGGRIALLSLDAAAREAILIATGRLEVESFDCTRTGSASWERGAVREAEDVGLRAEMSAEMVEQCVVFRLLDLERDPPGAFAQLETGSGRVEAARALLFDAVRLLLEDRPLCPELPPELEVLAPHFDRAGPAEIEDGGVGVALEGSIDMSPRALVELLRVLQARGAVPPPP